MHLSEHSAWYDVHLNILLQNSRNHILESIFENLTFRRQVKCGTWCKYKLNDYLMWLGIPITVRSNCQTRYTIGNGSAISVIFSNFRICGTWYWYTYCTIHVCKLQIGHRIQWSLTLIWLDLAYHLQFQHLQYMIWYTTFDIYIFAFWQTAALRVIGYVNRECAHSSQRNEILHCIVPMSLSDYNSNSDVKRGTGYTTSDLSIYSPYNQLARWDWIGYQLI